MPESPRVVASAPARSLDAVLDAAATVIAVITLDGEHIYGNPWVDAIPDGQQFSAHEALARVAHGESPVHVDLGMIRGDDEPHPVCWTLIGLPGPGGDVAHVLATGVDAIERDRVEADLRDLTRRDALTGLFEEPGWPPARISAIFPFLIWISSSSPATAPRGVMCRRRRTARASSLEPSWMRYRPLGSVSPS